MFAHLVAIRNRVDRSLAIDLEALGVRWFDADTAATARSAYSDPLVALLDYAASLARFDGLLRPDVVHVLACFSDQTDGVMGTLRERHGIDGPFWRAALAKSRTEARAPLLLLQFKISRIVRCSLRRKGQPILECTFR